MRYLLRVRLNHSVSVLELVWFSFCVLDKERKLPIKCHSNSTHLTLWQSNMHCNRYSCCY